MIDRKAPVVVETSIEIEAAPADVWRVLTEVARWPEWHEGIASAKLGGALAEGSTIDWQIAGQEAHATITRVAPASAFDWEGTGGEMRGMHSWQLEPSGRGTRLSNSESVEDGFASTDSATMRQMLFDVLQTWNSRLKTRAESLSHSTGDLTPSE